MRMGLTTHSLTTSVIRDAKGRQNVLKPCEITAAELLPQLAAASRPEFAGRSALTQVAGADVVKRGVCGLGRSVPTSPRSSARYSHQKTVRAGLATRSFPYARDVDYIARVPPLTGDGRRTTKKRRTNRRDSPFHPTPPQR